MNKKIKRVIPVILSVLSCASFTFAACGHTHAWEWKSENGMHWQECKGCDEKTTPEKHKDTDSDNKCDDCSETLAPAPVAVTGVTVSGDETVVAGQTITLTATVAPDNATDKTVSWTSSDTSKATVSGGVVTGVAEGTVTITATAGGKSGTKQITVTAAQQQPPVGGETVAVEKVELNKTTASLTVGSSDTLTATVTPDNATDATVEWSSSDTAKVTVSSQGLITAVAVGSATITATAGGKTAECEVTVTAAQQSGTTSTPLPEGKKIYVVGDSTVCDYVKAGEHEDVKKNSYYVVRYGYGTQMHEYLNVEKSQVVNLALSGRSSLSYLTENNYTTLSNSISEGDYLIIGFGHNDQKTEAANYTNPNLTTTDSSKTQGPSFKYTLYENYIKLAEEKGATPVLCTPVVRHNPSGNYSGSSGHITEDKTVGSVTYKGGDYPKAIRDLAEEKNVALVDLTAITKQIYTANNAVAVQYHAYYTYKLDTDGTTKIPDNPDTTHLNELGAKMVAYQFAQAIKTTDCGLKNHVRTEKSAPTYDNDFVDRVNASYTKPTADTFTPDKASATWTSVTEQNWYGTVFGDIGGQNKINATNFGLSASNGTFVVDCKSTNGKFSDTEGIAAIFMPIDANKDFTAEVTATVVPGSGISSTQSSFGLMLRDDIYIDEQNKSIKSNYISAGVLNGNAIFSMKDETRTLNSDAMSISAATYTLKIEKSGNSVTATVIQGGKTVTKTFTNISLTSSDPSQVYLCLYAIRSIKVTFTDVNVSVSE